MPAFLPLVGGTIAGSAIASVTSGQVGAAMSPTNRMTLYAANVKQPNLVPSLEDAASAWLAGYITEAEMQQLARVNGACIDGSALDWMTAGQVDGARRLRDIWDRVIISRESKPPLGILFELRNRDLLNDDQVEKWIRRLGFNDSRLVNRLQLLRNPIPSYQEIVHFAVKESWNQGVVDRFGYDEEFPTELGHWMGKLGLDYDSRSPGSATAGDQPIDWAHAVWRAHWEPISPSQAYQMYHMLRPGRNTKFAVGQDVPRVFTKADLDLLLKVRDYPPAWRTQLAAINYLLPERRIIKQMFEQDVIDGEEVYQQLKDRGYTETDAQRQARMYEKMRRATRARHIVARSKAAVADAYDVGTVSRDEAAVLFYQLQFDDPEELRTFQTFPAAVQLTQANIDPAVQFALREVDYKRTAETAKAVIRAIRHRFLAGKQSESKTRGDLATAGIDQVRIDEYVDAWKMELDRGLRELSTAKIQTLIAKGLMSFGEANTRLENLGWSFQNIPFILAEAQQNLQMHVAKAQAASARTNAQRQRAQAQIAKAAAHAQHAALVELAKYGSPANLTRWYVRGTLPRNIFVRRIGQLVSEPIKQAAWIRDADKARTDALEKAVQSAKKPSPAKTGKAPAGSQPSA